VFNSDFYEYEGSTVTLDTTHQDPGIAQLRPLLSTLEDSPLYYDTNAFVAIVRYDFRRRGVTCVVNYIDFLGFTHQQTFHLANVPLQADACAPDNTLPFDVNSTSTRNMALSFNANLSPIPHGGESEKRENHV
jgi:hypothetical protein